jgi:hypothetical protein
MSQNVSTAVFLEILSLEGPEAVKTQSKYLPLFVLIFAVLGIQILTPLSTRALAGGLKPLPSEQNDEDKLFPYPIPADLPIPEKAVRLRRSFNSSTLNYTFGCAEGSPEIISFFRDQLPKRGWKTTVTSASEDKAGPTQSLSNKKEEDGRKKTCWIRIVPIRPGVTMTGSDGEFSNPPFKSYVTIQYLDPALVPKPLN